MFLLSSWVRSLSWSLLGDAANSRRFGVTARLWTVVPTMAWNSAVVIPDLID